MHILQTIDKKIRTCKNSAILVSTLILGTFDSLFTVVYVTFIKWHFFYLKILSVHCWSLIGNAMKSAKSVYGHLKFEKFACRSPSVIRTKTNQWLYYCPEIQYMNCVAFMPCHQSHWYLWPQFVVISWGVLRIFKYELLFLRKDYCESRRILSFLSNAWIYEELVDGAAEPPACVRSAFGRLFGHTINLCC